MNEQSDESVVALLSNRSTPSPDVDAAYASVTRRVQQVSRRRLVLVCGAACIALVSSLAFAGGRSSVRPDLQPGGPATDLHSNLPPTGNDAGTLPATTVATTATTTAASTTATTTASSTNIPTTATTTTVVTTPVVVTNPGPASTAPTVTLAQEPESPTNTVDDRGTDSTDSPDSHSERDDEGAEFSGG